MKSGHHDIVCRENESRQRWLESAEDRARAQVAMTPDSTRRECFWLDIGSRCSVEVTSQENGYPIEAALQSEAGFGWRAAASGAQTIRLIFADLQKLQRIWLMFEELENSRTQEFVLRSRSGDGNFQEIVRQQWNFSPNGSVREI
jgi:hypothetical protein